MTSGSSRLGVVVRVPISGAAAQALGSRRWKLWPGPGGWPLTRVMRSAATSRSLRLLFWEWARRSAKASSAVHGCWAMRMPRAWSMTVREPSACSRWGVSSAWAALRRGEGEGGGGLGGEGFGVLAGGLVEGVRFGAVKVERADGGPVDAQRNRHRRPNALRESVLAEVGPAGVGGQVGHVDDRAGFE